MSIWAVNWAFHTEVAPPVHKLVLVALANFADDEDLAWPHVETLAGMASVSTRTVQRALKALEEAGLIERSMGLAAGARGGLRRTNSVYRLNVPDDLSRRKGVRTARPGVVREFSSFTRGDISGAAVEPVNKGPSQVRCDTGVVTVDRCDTGDANRCDTGDASIGEPSLVEPPSQAPLPPTAWPGAGSGVGLAGLGGEIVADDGGGSSPSSRTVEVPVWESAPAGLGRKSGPGASSGPPGVPAVEDWDLVRRCLPQPMQALDGPGAAVVVPLLRERLEAGWRSEGLREVLAADPLPDRVRHLAGLVAHRLGRVPVDGAPPPSWPRSSSWRMPDPPSSPPSPGERNPVAVRAEAARAEAIRTGSRDATRPRSWWLRRALEAADGRTSDLDVSGVRGRESLR